MNEKLFLVISLITLNDKSIYEEFYPENYNIEWAFIREHILKMNTKNIAYPDKDIYVDMSTLF